MNDSTTEDPERQYFNGEDCNSMFEIPAHLLEKYGATLPSKAKLRVDNSGKKWRVSIEKFRDTYFFTDGWKEFAEQVDLMSLDWLKFKLGSSSNQTGASQEQAKKTSCDVNGATSSFPNETKENCSRVVTGLSFTITTKCHHRYRLAIPKQFILDTGMCGDEKIKLKDWEGRERQAHVRRKSGIFSVGGGWNDFVKDNKDSLMVGSKISFTWLPGNVLQGQIVDMGTHNQPLHTAVQNRYFSGARQERPKKTSCDVNRMASSVPNETKGDCARVETELSFTKTMKNYHRYMLCISRKFVLDTGIQESEKIKLKDWEGRERQARVAERSGLFFLCEGWVDFVKDNKNLMIGSKILFTWLSGNIIQAQIVDMGTGKKPLCTAGKSKGKHNKKKTGGDSILNEEKSSFYKEMKEYHRNCLDIPRDFIKSVGLHKHEEIKLMNVEGKEWPVHLIKKANGSITMCKGWTDFMGDNEVMLGSTITFTWLSGNMIQTEIRDVGTDKQPLFCTPRRKLC